MSNTEVLRNIVHALVGILRQDLTVQELDIVNVLVRAGYLTFSGNDVVERTEKPIEDK